MDSFTHIVHVPCGMSLSTYHNRHRIDKKVQSVETNGFIPKPPPFIHDLTKLDKQNNNSQHQQHQQQSVGVQTTTTTTTATVHVPKQQPTGKIQ